MSGWRLRAVIGVVAVLGVALVTASASRAQSNSLERGLLEAVQAVSFDHVIDFGPVEDVCPSMSVCPSSTPNIATAPNVDVAVIELARNGRARRAANVILSRDYPEGLVVPIGRNFGTGAVRFRRWDVDRWNGGTFASDGGQTSTEGWNDNPPRTAADDIVAGRERAPFEFMAPYPASLFKLIVAFHTLRLVDRGILGLETAYAYDPAGGCGAAAAGTETNRRWLDSMITSSDNRAACALLKQLHGLGEVEGMNAELRELGLGTLQVNGTSALTGGVWQPGQIHMTALDTARLLWLINGAPGVLWQRPDGRPVTARVLSDSSRALLGQLLVEQGFNVVLSTTNFCGLEYPSPGIPQRVAERWIDPSDGSVTVEGMPYGQDVRPCNAAAEVSFAHKTGLTYNYGSDAGVVRSLPGKPSRRYVIAFLSNLGYRYSDARFAASRQLPCFSLGFCYTEKIAQLAKRVDDLLRGQPPAVQQPLGSRGHMSDVRAGEARRRAIQRTGG
jgi:Beta-lactamase enzyme family